MTSVNVAGLAVTCPFCKHEFCPPVEYAGYQVRCAKCEESFLAPPLASMPQIAQPFVSAEQEDAGRRQRLHERIERLDARAAANNNAGVGLIWTALSGLVVAVLAGIANGPGAWSIGISVVAGALLGLGFLLRIIAQLLCIRAELIRGRMEGIK